MTPRRPRFTEGFDRDELVSGKLSSAMTTQPEQPAGFPESVHDALWRGKRSEAIDLLQREWSISRDEARELVGSFILANRSLQRRMGDEQPTIGWGFIRWLILFQAIVVAIGYYLFYRDW